MFYIVFAIIFILIAIFGPNALPSKKTEWRVMEGGAEQEVSVPANTGLRWLIRVGSLAVAFLLFIATSFVVIDADKVGHLNKKYLGRSMAPNQVIAVDGQKGPQAEVLPPGFQFRPFLNVLYDVKEYPIINIPEAHYGFLVTSDGRPLGDRYLAAAWNPKDFEKMLDAEYFLTHGGQKGQQLSVLTPGKYRLNQYLFKVTVRKATDVPAGFVGVVKSNIQETEKLEFAEVTRERQGSLSVPLVKRGSTGVWDEALPPGRYYLNEEAYNVTLVDTRVQTWNYKGGYKRRYIDLRVTQDGKIAQAERSEDITVPDDAADSAIFTRMEGWLVPQELRVQVQVEPVDAPFLVASVGNVEAAENKVVTPSIRSVVRNICAAEQVLNLINENRSQVEARIEQAVIPEGKKAGVSIKDVRLVDSAVPPELLVARLREQLAGQLSETYKREREAQDQRILTEKARATADQQPELVASEIRVKVAEKDKQANQLQGEGEKLKLMEVAKGQKAQVEVLGPEKVMQLAVLDKILEAAVQNPNIVKVPGVLVQGGGSSLEGAAAILGASNLIQSMGAAGEVGAANPKLKAVK